MIKKILKICLFITLGILQVTLIPILSIKSTWPNIVLITIVLLILFDFDLDAYLLAGIGGLVLDLSGIMRPGLNIIFFISMVYLLNIICEKYITETNFFNVFITVFITSILYSLYNYLFLANLPGLTIFYQALYSVVFAEIIYSLFNHKLGQKTIFKLK
jgi:hypothetical protein